MRTHPFDPGSQNDFSVNWPGYVWRFAGLILSLVIIAVGLFRGSTTIVILGSAIFVVFTILSATSLWALNHTNKLAELQTVEFLFKLSQTRASDTLACVDLGLRWPAVAISQNLTSGRMHVIDIYNPQLMPAKSLVRARHYAAPALTDPRLVWYDSNLDLLPLPDDSISAVFLYHVLSELAQKGDQRALLKEVGRILEPNGRLLVAEMENSWPNRLRPGSTATNLHPHHYWNSLLSEAGFEVQRTQTLQGLTVCVRANKPSPYAGKQMALDLDFEAAF